MVSPRSSRRPRSRASAAAERERAPASAERSPSRPRPLALLVAALALLAPVALADGAAHLHPVWGPALAAHEAAEAEALRTLAAAHSALERASHGVRARFEALPSATWSGAAGRGTSVASSLVVTGRLDWSDDPGALAAAHLAGHRALVAHVETVHRAVRAATGAYLDLRRAHVALAVAEGATQSRRATFARAEASVLGRERDAPGRSAASDVELEVARLELERALATVQRAARDLGAAERRAASLGIDVAQAERAHASVLAADPLEGWRLVPPAADAEGTLVERRRIEYSLALARTTRRTAWSALDDVRLEGALTGRDARLRVGLALDEGRPAGFVEGSLRPAARPSWSVGIRLRARVDDAWPHELEAARWALLDAEAALAEALEEERWAAAEALGALRDAEDDVAFAERALALGRAALRDLDEERLAIAAAARAGTAGAEERLGRFDEAYARSVLGHLRERDAFLRAWIAYLRAAERAWVRVAEPFAVRPAPAAAPQTRVVGR